MSVKTHAPSGLRRRCANSHLPTIRQKRSTAGPDGAVTRASIAPAGWRQLLTRVAADSPNGCSPHSVPKVAIPSVPAVSEGGARR